MKYKLTLLLVALAFFASAFSQHQYPIQTMFKGDSVVILKYDQAVEINNLLERKNAIINESSLTIGKYGHKVALLKDTISSLRWDLKVTQADLLRKLNRKSDSLIIANSELERANKQIVFYQGEMKRIEKLEWIERRTRVQMKIGIIGAVVTWVVLAITSSHQ